MPSQSTLNAEEKAKVKSAIPNTANKIHYAAFGRIYYAYPQPRKWSYAGLQGALVFCTSLLDNSFYFRMVDLDGTRGIIWQHELYDGIEFNQDRPFFHSFEGDKCMIGFVYADESEAKAFYKKVNNRKVVKSKPAGEKKKKKAGSVKGKIDKSMISGPKEGSFIHVAHMGYDSEAGFTSSGVDPSWTAFLTNLEDSGVGKDVIAREMEFIKKFVREHPEGQDTRKEPKKPKPPPPAPRRGHTSNGSTSSPVTPQAPPPPPSRPQHNLPPPPPSRPQQQEAPAPPSRPPPMKRTAPPPIAPRPSSPPRASPAPPAPPRPPPRPASTANAPPPPPARPTSNGGSAPPPPARPTPNGGSAPRPPPRPATTSA
ncbi:hypothetical protein CVT24_005596, partial [Panaeolus cyanescens]